MQWMGVLYVFGIHPLLDLWIGEKKESFSAGKNTQAREWVQQTLVHLALPIQVFLTVRLWTNLDGAFFLPEILSWGLVQGAYGITAAHELIHRKSKFSRGCGVVLLALSNYTHFRTEHVLGHHKWVGTLRDPATARKGEGLYAFWLRSLIGCFRSAWELERNRAENGAFHRFWIYGAITLFLQLGVLAIFGCQALFGWWLGSVVSVLLLETVNYIEHYGLVREGLLQPVGDSHSWDTRSYMTNSVLFNLGKHAHHHAKASVPFFELRVSPTQRTLHPWGYSVMILLALVPPLWRRVLDPRLPTQATVSASR
jgi:alkane 1-monooxygenase